MKSLIKIIPFIGMVLLFAMVVYASGGEAQADAKKEWMDIAWRFTNFVILVGLLWYYLADKVKSFFGQRRTEIAQVLEEIDKSKTESEKQFLEYETKFKNIGDEIQNIRNMLMGEIESEKQRIIEESKISAQRVLDQAKTAADQESLKARQELRDYVVDLAGNMALSMVTNNIQDKDQERIVEDYLNKVAREN